MNRGDAITPDRSFVPPALPVVAGGANPPPATAGALVWSPIEQSLMRWDRGTRVWQRVASTQQHQGHAGLRKWWTALGRVRAGTGDARIACIGDSTTAGYGTTGNGSAGAWPALLANILNGYGVPAARSGPWGVHQSGISVDERVTLADGWTYLSGGGPLGGWRGMVSGAGTLELAIAEEFDKLTVWYPTAGVFATGGADVSIDAEATLGSPSANGASGWGSVTYTVTAGVHTVKIKCPQSGSNWFPLAGIETRLSTEPRVLIHNWGANGQQLSDTNFLADDNAYDPLRLWTAMSPDLTIINYGINDINNGYPLQSYAARMATLVERATSVGSVLLVVPNQPGTTYVGHTRQWDKLRELIHGLGYPVLDLTARWGTNAQGTAAGLTVDEIHPNDAGYGDIANAVARAILQ